MAYKQTPGRGKSNPLKKINEALLSPMKLEQNGGDKDEKTIAAESEKAFDVFKSLSYEVKKGPGMLHDIVPSTKPPTKPAVPSETSLGKISNDKPSPDKDIKYKGIKPNISQGRSKAKYLKSRGGKKGRVRITKDIHGLGISRRRR
tara:strand:+ start:289 stop:726 length:438 start_codon:yes stop_codon:yes gene_type:complete